MDINIICDNDGFSLNQKSENDEEYDIYFKEVQIGFAELFINNKEIIIENFEIYNNFQFKGYGRKIIKILKSIPNIKALHGSAVIDSLPFWSKMGASFNEREMNEYINTSDEEFNELIPFKISC